MKKIILLCSFLFIASCSSNSHSNLKHIHQLDQKRMITQVTNNSQNSSLIEALNNLMPRKQATANKLVTDVLNDSNSDIKSIADAEMILAFLTLSQGNSDSAFQHFKSSSNKDNAYSQYIMASYYNGHKTKGILLPRDDVKKFNYTKKASENNNADAQNSLAMLYLEGRGVKKSFPQWHYWMGRSCENNNQDACTHYYDTINEWNNVKRNLNLPDDAPLY